jgi:hypothetical protein
MPLHGAAARRSVRLTFEDRGQACTWWDIAPDGPLHWVVVGCEAEAWLWHDSRLSKNSIGRGKAPVILGTVITRIVTTIPVVQISRRPPPQRAPLVSHAVTDARTRARRAREQAERSEAVANRAEVETADA